MPTPDFQGALTLCAFGLLFLLPALVVAARLLPQHARPLPSWSAREVVTVVLTPILLLPLFASGAGADLPKLLLLNQALLGVTAVVVLLLARRRRQGLEALGLVRGPGLRSLLAAGFAYPALFLTLLGLGGMWQVLLQRWGQPLEQDVMRLLLELDRARLLLALPIVTLVGPLLEEFLFRGFLQGVLAARFGDRVGIGVTALVFAALHGLAPLPMLLGLALFLGWLQARTRSLWVPFAVHAVHNGLTVGLALLASSLVS